MSDLTLLYYTANVIRWTFADAVRRELLTSTGGKVPMVCVSQDIFDFPIREGRDAEPWYVCVGDIGASIYNVYRQGLIGAEAAKTRTRCPHPTCG